MANKSSNESTSFQDEYDAWCQSDAARELYEQITIEAGDIQSYIQKMQGTEGVVMIDDSHSDTEANQAVTEMTEDSQPSTSIQEGTTKSTIGQFSDSPADEKLPTQVRQAVAVDRTDTGLVVTDTPDTSSEQSEYQKSQNLVEGIPSKVHSLKQVVSENLLIKKDKILVALGVLAFSIGIGLIAQSGNNEENFTNTVSNVDSSPKIEYDIQPSLEGELSATSDLSRVPVFIMSSESEEGELSTTSDLSRVPVFIMSSESAMTDNPAANNVAEITSNEAAPSDSEAVSLPIAPDTSVAVQQIETDTSNQDNSLAAAIPEIDKPKITTNQSIVNEQIPATSAVAPAEDRETPRSSSRVSTESDESQVTAEQLQKYSLTSQQIGWLQAAGIAESDWNYVDYIVTNESNWKPQLWNQQGSSAFGLCQRMMSVWPITDGDNYMTDPVAQLEWCDWYAHQRYGSWEKSYNAWRSKHWW